MRKLWWHMTKLSTVVTSRRTMGYFNPTSSAVLEVSRRCLVTFKSVGAGDFFSHHSMCSFKNQQIN